MIYVSTNTGEVVCYNLIELFNDEDFDLKIIPPASIRPNYNPYRDKKVDFKNIISNSKAT